MAASSTSAPASRNPTVGPSADRPSSPGWPSLVAGGVAVVIVLGLAWSSGGYYAESYLAAGGAALAVTGVLLVVRPPRYELSTPALVGLAGLAGLTIWTGLSSRWSPASFAALEAMQRNMAYLGVLGLGVYAAGSGRYARQLGWAIMATIAVIVGAGLLSRLFPDVVGSPPPFVPVANRLDYPLSYWNAYGALAAMGTVMALGLAGDRRSPPVWRAVSAAGALVFVVAMYLSLSRGAWVAMAAGVVVLVAIASNRLGLLLSIAAVGGLSLVAVLRLHGHPVLFGASANTPVHVQAGHGYALELVILALVAAAVQLALTRVSSTNLTRRLQAIPRQPVLIAFAALIVLLAGVYAVKGSAIEGFVARALTSTGQFVERQWSEFQRPSIYTVRGPARLRTARGTRSEVYRVAYEGFRSHPAVGEGAGSFEIRWYRERRVPELLRNAHSLYLETLAELGLVGFAFLLLFVGSVVAAVVRATRRPTVASRSQAAAFAAALSVWLVHTAIDWDWQMGSLTAVALLLAGVLYSCARRRRRRRPEPA